MIDIYNLILYCFDKLVGQKQGNGWVESTTDVLLRRWLPCHDQHIGDQVKQSAIKFQPHPRYVPEAILHDH